MEFMQQVVNPVNKEQIRMTEHETLFNMSDISTIQQESGISQDFEDPTLKVLKDLNITLKDHAMELLIQRLMLIDEVEIK